MRSSGRGPSPRPEDEQARNPEEVGAEEERSASLTRVQEAVGNRFLSAAVLGGPVEGLPLVLASELLLAGSEGVAFESPFESNALMQQAMRHAAGPGLDPIRETDVGALIGRSRGVRLPEALAARLGRVLGADVSDTRIHVDGAAAAAAEALRAEAFALGADVYFGTGAWAPGTPAGDEVLAHELTHVVQYREGRLPAVAGEGLQVSSPSDPAEREAEAVAAQAVDDLATEPPEAPIAQGSGSSNRGPVMRQPAAAEGDDEDEDKDEKKERKDVAPDMFERKVDEPRVSGQTTVEKANVGPGDESTIVKFVSPTVEGSMQATLKDEFEIGEGQVIRVGPVQTLKSQDLRGTYTRGKEVVASYGSKLGMMRDARPYQYEGDTETWTVEPPFYSKTANLSDSNRTATPDPWMDRLTQGLPLKYGGGVLTAISGTSKFDTSLGAQREGVGTVTMDAFAWEMRWDMQLSEELEPYFPAGTGDAHGIVVDLQGGLGIAIPTEKSAKEIAGTVAPQVAFASKEAAMNASTGELWAALVQPPHPDFPDSHAFVVQALQAKGASLQVCVTVTQSADAPLFGSPTINLFATAHQQCPEQSQDIAEGASGTFIVALGSVVDLARVKASDTLSVWVGEPDQLGEFAELPWPFTGSRTIDAARGTYDLTITGP